MTQGYTNLILPDYIEQEEPEEKVIWKPLPGSQTLSLSCPASVILTHGTRGPGKTDGQLMRFRRFVGQGYGKYLRGIIFDREYKNLDDIVSKSRRWFPEFNDGAEFKTAKSDYKWVWPTGEELLFRTLKDPKDYWAYHGQEFCPHVDTIVKTQLGYVRIGDVKEGDTILTPSGMQKIKTVLPVRIKDGVCAEFVNAYGVRLFQQRQSVTHKLLTNDTIAVSRLLETFLSHLQCLDLCYLCEDLSQLDRSVFPETLAFDDFDVCTSIVKELCSKLYDLSEKIRQSLGVSHPLPPYSIFDPCDDPKTCNRYASLVQGLGSYDEVCFRQPLNFEQLQQLFYVVRELFEPLVLSDVFSQQMSNLHRFYEVFYELCQVRTVGSKVHNLDLLQHSARQIQHLHCLLQTSDVLVSAHVDFEKPQDFQWCCYSDYDLHGEQLREDKEIVAGVVLLQNDVEESNRPSLHLGGVDGVQGRNLCGEISFPHPYLENKRVRTDLKVRHEFVKYSACGSIPTVDIEVENDNCYVTFGESFEHLSLGSVNKNCWIGWNELTKYPTDELFEAMMSCNRSSFRPEDHPIRDSDGKIIGYPPPIPLEVFATTNPFGPGHNWVKKRFIDKSKPGEILQTAVDVFNPRTQQRETFIKTQCHIFGSYRENVYLDPQYVAELEAIQDPNKRAAWLGGSWDITSGGMFDDVWSSTDNIVAPFMIPNSWRIFRSYDHGQSKPFSVGWWAESDGSDYELPNGKVVSSVRGDLFRIAEWYGWTGKQNQGLRMISTDIAKGIIERELAMGIHSRVKPGPADNAIWNVDDGNSIADKMEQKVKINGVTYKGVEWTKSDKVAGSRKAHWEVMRISMKNAHRRYVKMPDGTRCQIPREEPGLFVFSNCARFIDLIPSMPRDEVDQDDIDTNCEDHIADETGYAVASTALYKVYKNIKGI